MNNVDTQNTSDSEMLGPKPNLALEDFKATLENMDESQLRHAAINWFETACQFSNNEDFYRGLVYQAGEYIGTRAYICDDASRSESVLALKVPPIVQQLVRANHRMQGCLKAISENEGWTDHHARAWGALNDVEKIMEDKAFDAYMDSDDVETDDE